MLWLEVEDFFQIQYERLQMDQELFSVLSFKSEILEEDISIAISL